MVLKVGMEAFVILILNANAPKQVITALSKISYFYVAQDFDL